MRKFLVALLILSVMGGVFAQDKGEWSFGALSGTIQLETTLQMEGQTESNNFIGEADIYGRPRVENNYQVTAGWTFKKGDWSINLPLRVQNRYFGTQSNNSNFNTSNNEQVANITYNPSSPLTVTIPFEFAFDSQGGSGTIPLTWGRVNVNAVWGANVEKGGNGYLGYYFRGGFNDVLYGDGTAYGRSDSNRGIGVGATGGWYDFMDGQARLAVSYNDAFSTAWLRVSDIVLHAPNIRPSAASVANQVLQKTALGLGSAADIYHWENIGSTDGGQLTNRDSQGRRSDGIIYRYSITEDLDIGFAYTGLSGRALFGGSAHNTGTSIINFLTQPTIGVKFDNGTLGVSAMVMIQDPFTSFDFGSYTTAGLTTGSGYEPNDWADNNMYDIMLHIGGAFKVNESLRFNGDLAAKFQAEVVNPSAPGDGIVQTARQIFNFGAEVNYNTTSETLGAIWAKARIMALDFTNGKTEEFPLGVDNEAIRVPFGVWFGMNIAQAANNTATVGGGGRAGTHNDNNTIIAAANRINNNGLGNWGIADNGGKGFSAGLFFGIDDLLDANTAFDTTTNGMNIFLYARLGYREQAINEYLTFGLTGDIGVFAADIIRADLIKAAYAYEYGLAGVKTGVQTTFVKAIITPEVIWNIFPQGNIRFAYTFGKQDFALPRYTNDLNIRFTWNF